MNMLFQHLLFTSSNFLYNTMNILWHLWYLQYITISYKAMKNLMSRYSVDEDRPVLNHEMFCTLHLLINLYIWYVLKILSSDPKSKIKNSIYSAELWHSHKYNKKRNSSLKYFVQDWSETYHPDLNLVHSHT